MRAVQQRGQFDMAVRTKLSGGVPINVDEAIVSVSSSVLLISLKCSSVLGITESYFVQFFSICLPPGFNTDIMKRIYVRRCSDRQQLHLEANGHGQD